MDKLQYCMDISFFKANSRDTGFINELDSSQLGNYFKSIVLYFDNFSGHWALLHFRTPSRG